MITASSTASANCGSSASPWWRMTSTATTTTSAATVIPRTPSASSRRASGRRSVTALGEPPDLLLARGVEAGDVAGEVGERDVAVLGDQLADLLLGACLGVLVAGECGQVGVVAAAPLAPQQ